MIVRNFTNFFNRELMLYAIGDIKFGRPVSLVKTAYVLFFLVLWVTPNYLIFGIIISPYYAMWVLVPPIVLGVFAGRPVWQGRKLFDFISVSLKYASSPKVWADTIKADGLLKVQPEARQTIFISRRRELQHLADVRESRRETRRRRR